MMLYMSCCVINLSEEVSGSILSLIFAKATCAAGEGVRLRIADASLHDLTAWVSASQQKIILVRSYWKRREFIGMFKSMVGKSELDNS